MADNCAHALSWASRGLRVFPVGAGVKYPPFVKDFYSAATSDKAQIRSWFLRDRNIGCATGAGLLVLDFDARDALTRFLTLGGHTETLTVSTPSGGCHLYFACDTEYSQSSPIKGMDVRSKGGYVLAPGSAIHRKGRYTIAKDIEIAPLPPHMHTLFKERGSASRTNTQFDEPPSEVNHPATMRIAAHWLKTEAPLAIQGSNGDDTTYRVAAQLTRDFSITAREAHSLLLAHWNGRCQPPWDPDELYKKVENSYKYGTAPLGIAAKGGAEGIDPSPPNSTAPTQPSFSLHKIKDLASIPKRDWLVDDLLMRGAVTILAGQGGAGKSLVSVHLASMLANGRTISGDRAATSYNSLVYNAEDSIDELSLRFWASCAINNLDVGLARENVTLLQSPGGLVVAQQDGPKGPLTINSALVQELGEAIRDRDISFVCLDPLTALHRVTEADSTQMQAVLLALADVAKETHAAILLLHHINKQTITAKTAVDSASVRGATGIVNSTRMVLTLSTPGDDDLKRYQIDDDKKMAYLSLSAAKSNLTETGHRHLLRKTMVEAPNGENVVGLKVVALPKYGFSDY